MNRHIGAYRGKDNENNWHYGFLDFEDDSLCIHVVEDISPNWNEPGGGLYSKYEKIDFKTIGQYAFTLGDQVIHEGDILADKFHKYLIFWDKADLAWKSKIWARNDVNLPWESYKKGIFMSGYMDNFKTRGTRLVGNIHDNPELVG